MLGIGAALTLGACTAAAPQSQPSAQRVTPAGAPGKLTAMPVSSAGTPQPTGAPANVPAPTDTYGTSASVVAPAGAITVNPSNFVATAQSAGPGAIFLLTPGVYTNVALWPKDGQQFFGQVGAVIDGQNRVRVAFDGTGKNVRISNLVVQNYTNPAQIGAIHGQNGSGWEVDHNEIRYTAGLGLHLGPYMYAHDNWVHHNLQEGVSGAGPNIVVSHNDISYNNYTHAYDPGWEAGGTKFYQTTNLVVKSNNVHHNSGPGLWTDIGNVGTTYDSNWVHDNNYSGNAAGIFHEISGSAVIKNNLVVNNGNGWNAWAWNGGIQIACSSDVQVYGNQVLDNANGISVIQQNRYNAWAPGSRNISVHDNIVRANGLTGFVSDTGEAVWNGSRNVHFSNNTYLGGNNRFAWANQVLNPTQWKNTGNDVTGTFN